MKYGEFKIGLEFYTVTGKWRCTDVGTRTIAAIQIDRVDVVEWRQGVEAHTTTDDPAWFNGPPYGVAEHVFDELATEGCSLVEVDVARPPMIKIG